MPRLTMQDAKTAIAAAEDQYYSDDPKSVEIRIGDENVRVICNKPRNADRIDFGLPAIWVFEGSVKHLTQWWLERHPTSGEVLAREDKGDLGFQVNLQFWAEGRALFNYHLSVQ